MFNKINLLNKRKCPNSNYSVDKSVCERKYGGERCDSCKYDSEVYNSKVELFIYIGIASVILLYLAPTYVNIAISFAAM